MEFNQLIVMPKPFLKWVGGKTRLLPTILSLIPSEIEQYYEPFLGGGAVFFALTPQKSNLSDRNRELIDTYRVVRDDVEALIAELSSLETEYLALSTADRKQFYLGYRDRYNRIRPSDDLLQVAILFIFLNKTCYNGLYRVNSQDRFNVPPGDYTNPTICDRATQTSPTSNTSFTPPTRAKIHY